MAPTKSWKNAVNVAHSLAEFQGYAGGVVSSAESRKLRIQGVGTRWLLLIEMVRRRCSRASGQGVSTVAPSAASPVHPSTRDFRPAFVASFVYFLPLNRRQGGFAT